MTSKNVSGNLSEQAHAYTPGLAVKRAITIRKTRRLPIHGNVLVKVGDKVDFDTVVAQTLVPGDSHIVLVSDLLTLDEPEDIQKILVKKEGESVKKGEIYIRKTSFFGLINKTVQSPVDGKIERVSPITGAVTISGHPVPVEVKAYIPGEVAEILPQEGAVIETDAALIQGILGLGGETWGEIVMAVKSPEEELTPEKIKLEHEGKIIVGGSFTTLEALHKAVEVGAKGLVVGGVEMNVLTDFMGQMLGVAITGHEEVGITLMITEGFGKMVMASRTFNLLRDFEGMKAAMDGTTQIRAGVLRPEIIIPHSISDPITKTTDEHVGGMRPGTLIRVIRQPHFGRIGKVVNLPVELLKVETESRVRVVEIELEGGERVIVPRANVELIEE